MARLPWGMAIVNEREEDGAVVFDVALSKWRVAFEMLFEAGSLVVEAVIHLWRSR